MTPGKTFKTILLTLFLLFALAGGAAAQNNGLTALITQVDSQLFPQVTAYVTVSDQNGPVFGLTADAFRALEDGKAVRPEAVIVQSDNTQNLNLVLALDTSMPEAELSVLKNAVNAFIDTLGAQDQVAVIAFYDEVVVAQNFTNDKRALKKAVSDLEPEGNRTALNEATFQAVSMVSAMPASQKAALIFTNSADNVSGRSVSETQDKARALGIPLFFYGFGERVEADVLQGMAASTGGQAFILSDVNQVADSLEAMSLTLRQGYRIVFGSSLEADGAEHTLTIRVSYGGSQGEAQSRFTAHPGPVSLAFTGLTDGQTVGGQVTLEVQVGAPAPVDRVEYLLDGRTLAEVKEAPYTYVWDSSDTPPGLHTLTAYVLDSAGNEGQLDLKLKVVEAIVVTASASKASAEVGDEIIIEAEVESLNDVAGVDFLVDGKLLQSDNKAPYTLSLDTEPYRAGKHTITVQARDALGQTAETEVDIELTAPSSVKAATTSAEESEAPKTGFDWGRWLKYIAIGVAILLLVPLLLATAAWQRRRAQALFRLVVNNQGNIRSRYALRTIDESGKLKFKFSLNNNPLPQRRITETPEQVRAEKGDAHDFGDLDFGDMDDGAFVETTEAESSGGGMMEKAGGIANMAGVVGELFYLLGSIMPRSLRTPIQRAGSRMRRGRMAMRRVERVSKKAGMAGEKVSGQDRSSGRSARGSSGGAAGPREAVRIWSQTPYVEPGHSLAFDLSVDQAGFFQTTKIYPFKILSKSIEIEDAPLLIEQTELQPKGGGCLMRLIKALLIAIAVAIPIVLCLAAVLTLTGNI